MNLKGNMDNKLVQFANQQFLNVETFRKNGHGVQTPVWFVEDKGTLYVRTVDVSAKVKRIRNNPRVRVMPCDARGGPKGEWVEGQARFADAAEAHRVNQLLGRKYGFQKTMFEVMSKLQGRKYTVIAINV
jgi:PPOX class probable F420-dependent enzyme